MTRIFRWAPVLRLVVAAFLAIAPLAIASCGEGPNAPAQPSPTANLSAPAPLSPGDVAPLEHPPANPLAKVVVCHRTEGSKAFVPVTVASSAVQAHRAHGDGLVGDRVPGQPGMVFASDCSPQASGATGGPVTVTFDGLQVDWAPVTSYLESGITVHVTAASWVALTGYGNPAPSMIFSDPGGGAPTIGEVRVSAGDATFKLVSLDVYSSTTVIPYSLSGLLGGSTVFTASGTVPHTFGAFATVDNPYADALIDTLVVSLTNQAEPCCDNPMGIDNLRLVR